MIEKSANELMSIIESFYSKYKDLDEKLTAITLSNNKWSLKQIIGHLIDSTSNNHQRFIRFQIDSKLNFPDYNRNEWLKVADYNNIHFTDLLNLFVFYNKLISNIIKKIDKDSLHKKWKINWDENKNYITLEELIIHYIKHIKEHFIHFENRLLEIKKNGSDNSKNRKLITN